MESAMPKNLVGTKLYQLRSSLGMSQAGLAEKLADYGLDIKACMLCKIEKQTRRVLDYELIAFSRAFDTPIDAFFEG